MQDGVCRDAIYRVFFLGNNNFTGGTADFNLHRSYADGRNP